MLCRCKRCVFCRARSPDDARDTFKTLKNQHIGDASAHLYYEWACLEHVAGNVSKALGVLAKGIRAEAQPARCGRNGTASASCCLGTSAACMMAVKGSGPCMHACAKFSLC
jgi:hypothetical protein